MVPKHKSSNGGNFDLQKENHKVLPLSEKGKVFDLIKNKKYCILRLLNSI